MLLSISLLGSLTLFNIYGYNLQNFFSKRIFNFLHSSNWQKGQVISVTFKEIWAAFASFLHEKSITFLNYMSNYSSGYKLIKIRICCKQVKTYHTNMTSWSTVILEIFEILFAFHQTLAFLRWYLFGYFFRVKRGSYFDSDKAYKDVSYHLIKNWREKYIISTIYVSVPRPSTNPLSATSGNSSGECTST